MCQSATSEASHNIPIQKVLKQMVDIFSINKNASFEEF